jgi:hypothetical protein
MIKDAEGNIWYVAIDGNGRSTIGLFMARGWPLIKAAYTQEEINLKISSKVWSDTWFDEFGRLRLDLLQFHPYVVTREWLMGMHTMELHRLLSNVNAITRGQSAGGRGIYDVLNHMQAVVFSIKRGEAVCYMFL